MPNEPDETPDPRTIRSRKVVLDAALTLMVERGIHALNIDGIAEQSGVAKTTIYRHWSSREAIILDALSSLIAPEAQGPTGTPVEQIHTLAWRFAEKIGTPPWSVLFPDLIALARRSERMRTVYEDFMRLRRQPVAEVIARAITADNIDAEADADVIALMILGAITFRQLVLLAPPDELFVRQVVSTALHQRVTTTASR
jgi:AcrR family transcriptional regulator